MSRPVREIVFWGATGQAKVLREILPSMECELVALFDDTPGLRSPFPDVPLHEGRAAFERWLGERGDREALACLVAIGGEHGAARVRIQRYLESKGLRPATAVHPTAHVAKDASLGAGSQILAHAVVAVESRIGLACIVNTAATVDHEGRLGDGVHLAGGAHLAGCVTVEDFAMIGTGAAVLPRLRIGTGAVVGAGAVVLHDVEPWTVVAGNPAKVIGRREPPKD
jgi:sugar O-acyltransferase (sialic acid O-acetyltransferase NeuD family)